MFKVFQKILDGSTISETESKKVSEFILLRWLSSDARLTSLAAALNCTNTKIISPHSLVLALQHALKGKIKFIKFPKKLQETSENREMVKEISEFFNISLAESREFLDWCNKHCPDEIETLKKILS